MAKARTNPPTDDLSFEPVAERSTTTEEDVLRTLREATDALIRIRQAAEPELPVIA